MPWGPFGNPDWEDVPEKALGEGDVMSLPEVWFINSRSWGREVLEKAVCPVALWSDVTMEWVETGLKLDTKDPVFHVEMAEMSNSKRAC